MGFVDTLLGILGFGIGIPFGLFLGFFIFVRNEPPDIKELIIRPLQEFDSSSWLDILPEIPLWVKNSDYERVDWLNTVIHYMWPYLNKAICNIIRSTIDPIFAEYIGKFQIQSIAFDIVTLGSLPPSIHGLKVYDSNEKHLVLEPRVRFAGNSNIMLMVKVFFLKFYVQFLPVDRFTHNCGAPSDLEAFGTKFSVFCKYNSFFDGEEVDFGLKVMGCDLMAIPGLYHFVQKTIKQQVASFYLWPQTFEIPVLDSSVGAVKKPVGLLHVKVLRAEKLLKMDLLSASDPYVKLSLSGERLPAKKTSVKMNNLNPEWNEEFKLTVKDTRSQVLELHVYDWEKVGTHDNLGMQIVPLKLLAPHEKKFFALDLHKNTNPNDIQNRKQRGKIMVELTFVPFKEENEKFSGPLDLEHFRKGSTIKESEATNMYGAGLLLITVVGAEDVEGKNHINPYALVLFKGEVRRTKTIKKTQDPKWDEEFQITLDEAPLKDTVHIEIMSIKRRGIGFRSKESLGYVDINLVDVVHNGRINEKYNLINSRNGVIHLDLRWRVI